MANPFESLVTEAQGYATQRAAQDPFNLVSTGLAQTPIQIASNPWASLAANLGRGLVAGGLNSVAQNRAQENFNNAFSQLAGSVQGQPVQDPSLTPFASRVQAAFTADAYDQQRQEAIKQNAFQRALLQNQLGTLYAEGVRREMDPETQSLRRRNIPVSNPAMEEFERKIGAFGPGAGTTATAAAPILGRMSATNAPTGATEVQRRVGTNEPITAQYVQTEAVGDSPIPPPPPPLNTETIKKLNTLEDAMRFTNKDPVQAKELLARRDQLKKEELAEKREMTPIEKEKRDFLATKSESLLASRNLISSIESALQGAGGTGGVLPFGIDQEVRKMRLKLSGDPSNRQRLASMATLKKLALEQVAETRKAFTGTTTDKDIELYLGGAISDDKTPAENSGLLDRMKKLHFAAEASQAFIQQKFAEGKTKARALAEYEQFDRKNPLFITTETGALEINPARLKGGLSMSPPPPPAPPSLPETPTSPSYRHEDLLARGRVFDPKLNGYVRGR